MGLFANARLILRQSEAAVVVQKLLEAQNRTGLGVDTPPALLANKMVQVVCDRNRGLREAKPLVNKFSLAASAFVSGVNVMRRTGDREGELAFASCLSSLMMDITARQSQLKFSPLDLQLLAGAEDVIARVTR